MTRSKERERLEEINLALEREKLAEFQRTLPTRIVEICDKAERLGFVYSMDTIDNKVFATFTLPAKYPPSPRKYTLCPNSQEWEIQFLNEEMDKIIRNPERYQHAHELRAA